MITPAGVQKPRGKKKGKVFIDDEQGMMTILAMVNAAKEGQIESKIARERQLEEIREGRRREAERRSEGKREELETVKQGLKKKNRRGRKEEVVDKQEAAKQGNGEVKKTKKRVSFA